MVRQSCIGSRASGLRLVRCRKIDPDRQDAGQKQQQDKGLQQVARDPAERLMTASGVIDCFASRLRDAS
ncbi:hypothetical protein AB4118_33035 [Bosea sp. 2RAB26]